MRPRREGVYQLCVLLNSEHVLGSPHLLTVYAAKPAAALCVLVPRHAEGRAGGAAATFDLFLRDEFGNELSSPPGSGLDLAFTPRPDASREALEGSISNLEKGMDLLEAPEEARAAAAAREAAAAERAPPTASWVVRSDGVVGVSVSSEAAGAFLLRASLDGVEVLCATRPRPLPPALSHRLSPPLAVFAPPSAQVRNSPAPFVVAAGPAAAGRSFARPEALASVRAGSAAALAVRCFDAFGNDACDAADVLAGELRRVGPAPLIDSRLPPVRARPPQPPGTAALMFTPSKVGCPCPCPCPWSCPWSRPCPRRCPCPCPWPMRARRIQRTCACSHAPAHRWAPLSWRPRSTARRCRARPLRCASCRARRRPSRAPCRGTGCLGRSCAGAGCRAASASARPTSTATRASPAARASAWACA